MNYTKTIVTSDNPRFSGITGTLIDGKIFEVSTDNIIVDTVDSCLSNIIRRVGSTMATATSYCTFKCIKLLRMYFEDRYKSLLSNTHDFDEHSITDLLAMLKQLHTSSEEKIHNAYILIHIDVDTTKPYTYLSSEWVKLIGGEGRVILYSLLDADYTYRTPLTVVDFIDKLCVYTWKLYITIHTSGTEISKLSNIVFAMNQCIRRASYKDFVVSSSDAIHNGLKRLPITSVSLSYIVHKLPYSSQLLEDLNEIATESEYEGVIFSNHIHQFISTRTTTPDMILVFNEKIMTNYFAIAMEAEQLIGTTDITNNINTLKYLYEQRQLNYWSQ